MRDGTKALGWGSRAFLHVCGPALLALFLLSGCSRSAPPKPPAHRPPQTSGTLQVRGLQAPATVVRDTWGIPHITAASMDDLFFAQGFVQAQDRLFQMDLWRRSVQGRLSEVLGANFIDRDAMTRRMQFRGDIDREWASYGPDTRRIAVAFTNGINAWVALARQDLPEEFALAGWAPEFWKPEDLLNRTDAFVASANAADDLFRARLGAAVGMARVDQWLPLPGGRRTVVEPGVDLSAITYVVPETLRRVGTPPFFLTLLGSVSDAPRPSQQPPQGQSAPDTAADREDRRRHRDVVVRANGSTAWAIGAAKSATGAPLLAVDSLQRFDSPSRRYLVHLSAPGWNVAGATSPWLPGVVIGHNERIAWGMAETALDTQDIFVERLNPNDTHQVERNGRWVDMAVDRERVDVKGRPKPFEYERMYTSNGVVIALDRQRSLVYTLRWSGAEPGGAGELAALAIGRANSWSEFREALSRWKMPTADFVYADVDGHVARQRAGLTPVRPAGAGTVPAAGWTGAGGWQGWEAASGPPREVEPGSAGIVVAGGSGARARRISEVLTAPVVLTIDDMRLLQLDVVSSNASILLPILGRIRSVDRDVAPFQARLLGWNREIRAESEDAALYVAWEDALRRLLVSQLVPSEFATEFAARLDLVAAVAQPSSAWFAGDPGTARDKLLVYALNAVSQGVEQTGTARPGTSGKAELTFTHPLAVFEAAKRRFDVGPFPLPGYPETVFATDDGDGPMFRAVFDIADWSRSMVMNAPGQAGSPASSHYDDLAPKWAAGQSIPLLFDPKSIAAEASDTLIIQPR